MNINENTEHFNEHVETPHYTINIVESESGVHVGIWEKGMDGCEPLAFAEIDSNED